MRYYQLVSCSSVFSVRRGNSGLSALHRLSFRTIVPNENDSHFEQPRYDASKESGDTRCYGKAWTFSENSASLRTIRRSNVRYGVTS